MITIWLAVLCFALSAVLTRALLGSGSRLTVLDHPNERSLHHEPTPSGGGLGIVAAILAGGIGAALIDGRWAPLSWVAAAAAIVFVVSFIDDRRPVHPGYRLGVHLLAAGLVVAAGMVPEALVLPQWEWRWPAAVGAAFAVLYLVWLINLYNFMDGMDGFAAGMAVVGFGTCALAGFREHDPLFTWVNVVICASSGGFLLFNHPPARIFMGDVGSSVLGLLAGAVTLWADRKDLFPLWTGMLIFSPFIVDATVTLICRASRGERVWKAHKVHFYQRLVALGWGHRRTVYWEYLLMALCAASAILSLELSPDAQALLLWGWALAYTVLMGLVYRLTNNTGATSKL